MDIKFQKHHLIPRQILQFRQFHSMLDDLLVQGWSVDHFRLNGIFLPANGDAVRCTGLPLHRGPHPKYNALVLDRFEQLRKSWLHVPVRQRSSYLLFRVELLQRALRVGLNKRTNARFILNRRDPMRSGLDFSKVDAQIDLLWKGIIEK